MSSGLDPTLLRRWVDALAEGYIYLTSAGVDPARLRLFAEYLVRQGIGVLVDRGSDIEYDLQQSASGTVLALGTGPTELRVQNLAAPAAATETLIPVKLTPGEVSPAVDGDLAVVDLSSWHGEGNRQIQDLIAVLRRLIERARTPQTWGGTLRDTWPLEGSRTALSEIQQLTGRISQLRELLADNAERTRDLRAALREVGATYRVVKSAVERFVAAGVGSEGIDTKAFASLERGLLAETIRNGRGHCSRIATYYERVGGLREAIAALTTPELLAKADATFDRLGTADGDLFFQMEQLGQTLTNEASVIVSLILTGRTQPARDRIAEGRAKLQPLEHELDAALAEFQEIEQSLGYAEDAPRESEAIHVSFQQINIAGSVVNSNIVAAEIIENSSIAIPGANISNELKELLTELHKSVAALTAELPEDEAALAAQDLEALTKEATSPAPRKAFWRRAADGLLAAASTVAAVGVPVVELTSKIITLLG